MNQIQKIIVPWDFSEHSTAALRYATRHFRGEAIKVICVLEPPNPYAPGFNWGSEFQEKTAEECRNEFLNQAGLTSEQSVNFQVRFGEPASEICKFADSVGSDFIVMSTHGRTGLQKLIMGSVAQKVIAQSKSPVILLPAKWFDHHQPQEQMADTQHAVNNETLPT